MIQIASLSVAIISVSISVPKCSTQTLTRGRDDATGDA
jgi:hypothetical protein